MDIEILDNDNMKKIKISHIISLSNFAHIKK